VQEREPRKKGKDSLSEKLLAEKEKKPRSTMKAEEALECK
jgi:hypothetical protein